MSTKEFDKWHSSKLVDADLNTPWHMFSLEQVPSLIKGRNNLHILEIGCGRGGFAVYFAERFALQIKELTAADFSEVAIEKARDYAIQKGIRNVNFDLQDIQNTSYPDNAFDLIFSFETIEHVPDPFQAVKELGRLLKPNGVLILTTPNYLGFFGLYRIYLRLTGRKWTEVGQPINQFVVVPKTIYWLRQAGFKIDHFDSEIISLPWIGKRKVLHLNWKKPRFILKWFGLQSFFVCTKK